MGSLKPDHLKKTMLKVRKISRLKGKGKVWVSGREHVMPDISRCYVVFVLFSEMMREITLVGDLIDDFESMISEVTV